MSLFEATTISIGALICINPANIVIYLPILMMSMLCMQLIDKE